MNSHLKRTLQIAAPSVIEYILLTFIQIINTVMVSTLGKVSTAAVALNAPIMWFVNGSTVLTSLSGTVLVANAIGAKNHKEANETAGTAITLSFFYGLILFITIQCIKTIYPVLMGADEDVTALTISYLFFYSLGLPLFVMGQTCSGVLKGSGNTKTPMKISFATNILLIFLNFHLIYEPFTVDLSQIPLLHYISSYKFTVNGLGLGVKGAAISVFISQSLAGLVLLLMVFKTDYLQIHFKHLFKISVEKTKSILKLGWPAAAEKMALNFGQIAFQKTITSLGTAAVSAHYLITTIESLCYMPAFGLGIATTALIGQAVGAKEFEDAKVFAKQNIRIAFIIGFAGGIFAILFPAQLLSLLTKEPDVIATGINSLRAIGVGECIYTAQILIMNVLQAGKETKPPFYSSLIGMWGIRLPLAYLLAIVFKMGLTGAWIALVIDITIRFIYLMWHYKREVWIKKFV